MEFIDTHSHNSDPAFRGEEEEVIARAVEAGVSAMIQADIDSSEREAMFELVSRHPGVLYPMLGLYPCSVDKGWRDEIDSMLQWKDKGIVAIGEIGLDYHETREFAQEQKEAFRVQLELASRLDLPVSIHLRDATKDFLRIIEDSKGLHLRGSLHAFSSSHEFYERVARTGDWYVGIGGVVTFKNASIAEEIRHIPLERIVLETDSPCLSPTPLRGTRNENSRLPLIAAKIAAQKGVTIEEVASVTTASARRLFGI